MVNLNAEPAINFGSIDKDVFLRDYWQRKPILIRNALPNFLTSITGDELAGLAMEELVESRLIFENLNGSPWQLKHGPFSEQELTSLPKKGWSLLVQGVDSFDDNTYKILNHFKFLPNWRLDDIMVSLAPDGGSVGPHFDHYDVFLLQGQGSRRWKIGDACDENSKKLKNTELSILEKFDVIEEFLLEPGDMLYLPPKIPHWGIAVNESITYSIGFRSPLTSEIIGSLVDDVLLNLTRDKQFTDHTDLKNLDPREISPGLIDELEKVVIAALSDKKTISSWFGKYMTRPRYPELFNYEGENDQETSTNWNELACMISKGNITEISQSPGSRFSFSTADAEKHYLFVNGQQWLVSKHFAELVCSGNLNSAGRFKTLLSNLDSSLGVEHDQQTLCELINLGYLSISDYGFQETE